jgi:hypothetical protein
LQYRLHGAGSGLCPHRHDRIYVNTKPYTYASPDAASPSNSAASPNASRNAAADRNSHINRYTTYSYADPDLKAETYPKVHSHTWGSSGSSASPHTTADAYRLAALNSSTATVAEE